MSQRGKPLNSQARNIVLNVKDYFEREKANKGFLTSVKKVQERVSEATGVGRRTLNRISNQKREKGEVSTPNKKRNWLPTVQPDAFDRDAIRRKIHQFYLRKELPTLDKLLGEVRRDLHFQGGKTTLWNILKELGFKYKTQDNRKYLTERNEVVALRYHYLRTIRNIRRQPIPPAIVYLDETWCNAHTTVKKCWLEFGNNCNDDDDDENNATGKRGIGKHGKGGLQVPTGKGKRLIVLHAGSHTGFVQGAKDVFIAQGAHEDYHKEMNSEHFEHWLETQLFPNIPEGSIIVMDNASYHSANEGGNVNSNSKRSAMTKWLDDHNIQYSPSLIRPQLYELIKRYKPFSQKKRVDELAKANGHKVV